MKTLCLRMLSVVVMCTTAQAYAEAGTSFGFCTESSCSCGTETCGCGEVCNGDTLRCMPSQTYFCGSDATCAANCGHFICEMNVCVPGVRPDSGTPQHPDASTEPFDVPDASIDHGGVCGVDASVSGFMPDASVSSPPAGPLTAPDGGTVSPTPPWGCSSALDLGGAILGLMLIARRRVAQG
jgi:hypothetical protein